MLDQFSLSEAESAILKGHKQERLTENDYDQISLDTFSILSDWYHYALLSLLELPKSKFDVNWISKRLGITRLEAKLAMERLKRLGIIGEVGGKWKQVTKPLKLENKTANTAIIKHHRQFLNKAEEALDNTEFTERDFSAMTFAMDSKLIPFARKKIQVFRRQLVEELEAMGTPNSVYHLSVQIYPVTKKEKKS